MKRTLMKMITALTLVIAMAAGMAAGFGRKAEAGSYTYTITFKGNGGTITYGGKTYTTFTMTAGSGAIIGCPKATRSGYTFLGYNTTSTATTAKYPAGQPIPVSGNMTLYAVWKKNGTPTSTMTVTYNVNSNNWFVDRDGIGVGGVNSNHLVQYGRLRTSKCTIADMPKINAYGIHPKNKVSFWVPNVDGKNYTNCLIKDLNNWTIQGVLDYIGKPNATSITFNQFQ